MQVTFANDEALAPQAETVPMALIYMREPYLDTHPISAAPLGPGAGADFRLIFDDIEPSWNQQQPALRVTTIKTN